jgi:hypothetical protein
MQLRKQRGITQFITGKRTDTAKAGLSYWGKIAGHRLYYWPHIDHMFAWRLAAINLAYDRLGFGMSNEGFDAWLIALEREFNAGNMAAIGGLITGIKEYKSKWGQYDTLMHIAGCGILVDGEPVGEFSERHNKIKEKLLREHPQVRAFFLNTSANYLRHFDPESHISEIKAYWESVQGQRMALFLSRITQIPRFENLWNSITVNSYGWQSDLVHIARMIWFSKPSPNTIKS